MEDEREELEQQDDFVAEETLIDEHEVEEPATVEPVVVEPVVEDLTEEEEVKHEETKKTGFEGKDIQKSAQDSIEAIKNIFTKPIDAIKEFVTDNNLIAGIIMILVTCITAGIFRIAFLKRAYDGVSKYYKPEYLKEFFTTAGDGLLKYAVLAGVAYLIVTKLFKGKGTIKQMIALVGISLSLVIIGNLVCSILIFIDEDFITNIISYIDMFATIFSVLIIYEGIKHISEVDKNKLFLTVATLSIIGTACVDIIHKIFD